MDAALRKQWMMAEQDERISEAIDRDKTRLRNFIRRRVADPSDAEDILQEVFYELVETYRLMKPIEQVGAWMFRVARNRITDALRQRQPLNRAVSMPGPIASGMDPSIAASEAAGPEAVHRHSIFVEHLVSALQELSAEQRSVFVAHEIDGLSIAEIAHRDGIGINTALARKRYAVLHLRKKLAPFRERYFTD